MPISLRSLAALVAVPLIALALTANLGFYTTAGMLAVLVAGLLVVAVCLLSERAVSLPPALSPLLLYVPAAAAPLYLAWLALHETSPLKVQFEAPLAALGLLVILLAYLGRVRPSDPPTAGLIGTGVLLTGTTVLIPQLLFDTAGDEALALVTQLGLLGCLILSYLVWLSFLAQPSPRRSLRGWHVRWGLLLVAGVGVRALAVIGSPEPVIDVHAWLSNAPRFLLEGRNPYASDYPSPYGTARAERFGIHEAPAPRPPTYPPTAILTGVPAALLGFDARWMNVLGEVVAALVLLLAGRACGRPGLGVLASGLYLSLPRAAFMIEQAWFEPQLAALLGLALLWAPRRPALAGVALGLLTAGKQYSLVLLLPLVAALRRQRRLGLVGLLVALGVTLPFILWSPADFWAIVVAGHLHRPVIYHALTIAALLKNAFGLTVPSMALWALAAVVLAALAWRTRSVGETGAALPAAAALLTFCLCHTQGFPNYYYLALFLLLLALAQNACPSEAAATE